MAAEKWYIQESELDDYQIRIVRRRLSSSFIVKGCAGSGKTVLALWRAKELAEKGEEEYLIIVFTKALKQFILDGIHEIGVDESKVMHHHQWKKMGSPKADYIIVDECQDFDREELLELRSSAKKHLILFGDSAQQLYKGLNSKGELLSMEQIYIMLGIPMEQLVINHRLRKKIARVAEEITLTNDDLEHRCKNEGVNKPFLIKLNSHEDQLDYIIDVCNSQNYTDVAILFPTNKQVDVSYDYFTKQGWDCEHKGHRTMDLDFTTDLPKIMTYHSAKGLQFEAVFIPGCNSGIYKERNRNPLYVAATRTYRDLFFLYSNSLSPFIGEIDRDLFKFEDHVGNEDNPF
jgi:superfamily I DNA/RNA helicase